MLKNAVVLASCLVNYAFAQSADAPRGHWSGVLEAPNRAINLMIDLDKTEKGWVGSMSVPEQGATGLPLEKIRSEGGQWKFIVAGIPGQPSFAGKLSDDGKTLAGEFLQGGNTISLKLTHSGEPKVELPKASPAVAKEFVGVWEGTLEGPGLRLRVTIRNEDGSAKATLVSIDQGGAEIGASAVGQKDATLTFEVKLIKGEYHGEINQDGTQLAGQWSQNGNEMPLVFKKVAAK